MILFTKNVLVTYIIEMCLKMTYNNNRMKKEEQSYGFH